MIGSSGSATAFRVALEARLRQAALESRVPLDRLRKEVAAQRMMVRLAATDRAEGWVLKGAQVLLVRFDQHARATKDADTTWRFDAALLDVALDDAADLDLGDGFEFQIGPGARIGAETKEGGWRYSVRALLDRRLFEQFVLDVNVSPNERPLRHARHGPLAAAAGQRRAFRCCPGDVRPYVCGAPPGIRTQNLRIKSPDQTVQRVGLDALT